MGGSQVKGIEEVGRAAGLVPWHAEQVAVVCEVLPVLVIARNHHVRHFTRNRLDFPQELIRSPAHMSLQVIADVSEVNDSIESVIGDEVVKVGASGQGVGADTHVSEDSHTRLLSDRGS